MADRDRIAALLPPGARFAACAIEGEAPAIHPEEAAFVTHAVGKRQRSFAFGRACARAALGQAIPILVGAGGAPVWPAGIHGSITHTDDDAAAAVAPVPIGIDLESRAAVARIDLLDMVALASERACDPALLFSAKESVYKCLYAGRFLEFHDVELAFTGDTFRVLRAGDYDIAGVRGRFALTATHDATVVFRTAPAAPAA